MVLKENCLNTMLIRILQNCLNDSNRISVYCDPDPGASVAVLFTVIRIPEQRVAVWFTVIRIPEQVFCLAVDAKADPKLLHDHLVEKDRVHEHEDPRAPVQDHENVRELLLDQSPPENFKKIQTGNGLFGSWLKTCGLETPWSKCSVGN